MEIPTLNLLSTSVRPDSVVVSAALFIMHHTHSAILSSTPPPSVLFITLPRSSHIVKPVHQLFRQTIFSALSQSSLPSSCHPARNNLLSYQHFRDSAGKVFAHGHLCMLHILNAPKFAQGQENRSMDALNMSWIFNKFTAIYL